VKGTIRGAVWRAMKDAVEFQLKVEFGRTLRATLQPAIAAVLSSWFLVHGSWFWTTGRHETGEGTYRQACPVRNRGDTKRTESALVYKWSSGPVRGEDCGRSRRSDVRCKGGVSPQSLPRAKPRGHQDTTGWEGSEIRDWTSAGPKRWKLRKSANFPWGHDGQAA
jgi:hypothetical protein